MGKIAGHDDVEQGDELALVVLDRCTSQADGHALLDAPQHLVRGRIGVLDGLHLVEHEKVETPPAELLDAAAHHPVRRERHVRPRRIARQLLAPMVEHRRRADHEYARAGDRRRHRADECDCLMRLAETHVVAQQRAETVLVQEPQPVIAGLLVAVEVHPQ